MPGHAFNFSPQLAPTGDLDVDVVNAHAHGINHRPALLRSDRCGCFDCLATFPPAAIERWIDHVDGVDVTALCPVCGADTVIGSASGFPIEDGFLRRMQQRWLRSPDEPAPPSSDPDGA